MPTRRCYNDSYYGTRVFLYHPSMNGLISHPVRDIANGHRVDDARHGAATRSSLLVTRRRAGDRVRNLEPFTGSNILGLWIEQDYYVTFSYHLDWPLFIYDAVGDQWFENADRYSMTTSHHRSALHPGQPTHTYSREALIDFLNIVTTLPRHNQAA